MKELDFSLATTEEIIKELARRAKQKRKENISQYGTQKEFAKHIGMSDRSYQQFEISGKISLEKFIDVLRGLNALEESAELLKVRDEDLFKSKNQKPKSSDLRDKVNLKEETKHDDLIEIPDVFD